MRAWGEGTARHTWRAGVIAGLIAAAGLLSGCSASADESSAGGAPQGGDVAYEDGGGGAGEAGGADAPAAHERSLIITGSMYMTVDDPIAAANAAASAVERAGGRIDARSETAPTERSGGDATLTMRIPSTALDRVVDNLRELGTVDHYSTTSEDVTTEVTDLDARISTLRASTERIQSLLDSAKDIDDIIALEDELSGRQATLESLEAQQRGLADQVSMATIELTLTTEPIAIEDDDASPSFLHALGSGWRALVAFLAGTVLVIGAVLPWAALAAIVFFGAVRPLVRRATRRRAAKAEAQRRAWEAHQAAVAAMQGQAPAASGTAWPPTGARPNEAAETAAPPAPEPPAPPQD